MLLSVSYLSPLLISLQSFFSRNKFTCWFADRPTQLLLLLLLPLLLLLLHISHWLHGQWSCQFVQSAISIVVPAWWQGTAGRKPAGVQTCGAALTVLCTAVVDHPWSSPVLSCPHHRRPLPGTRSRGRWQGWRCWRPSSVVSWTWASAPRSTLDNLDR